MTKLWIGLGVLIVIGALFSLLSFLRGKEIPEEKIPETDKEEESAATLRAVVHCTGGGAGFSKYRYEGVADCLAASLIPGGGALSCEYGCLGMGTCVKVCPTGALQVREGVAVVDGQRCTACGKCVAACPRHIISLEPFQPKKHVSIPCASQAKGEMVTELCTDGCIGCSLCVKACPKEAVILEGELARIDYEKCDNCGQCVSQCPRHLIRVERVEEPPKPEPPKEPKPPKEKKPKAEKKPKEPKKLEETKRDKDPRSQKLPKLKLSLKPKEKEKPASTLSAEVAPAEKKEVPVESAAPSKRPDTKTVPETEKGLTPASVTEGEEKPGRTSAEAFKAFEQAVAAAGEALGEKEEPRTPTREEEPAVTADNTGKTE